MVSKNNLQNFFFYKFFFRKMASKSSKILKKAAEKVIISDSLNINIPSGQALPGPPLGPELGQV